MRLGSQCSHCLTLRVYGSWLQPAGNPSVMRKKILNSLSPLCLLATLSWFRIRKVRGLRVRLLVKMPVLEKQKGQGGTNGTVTASLPSLMASFLPLLCVLSYVVMGLHCEGHECDQGLACLRADTVLFLLATLTFREQEWYITCWICHTFRDRSLQVVSLQQPR